MNGVIVGPVDIQLGYCGDLYVAPLRDQMLLDLAFLRRKKVSPDSENGLITLD
jgi:hypothetical protein